VSIGKITKKTR